MFPQAVQTDREGWKSVSYMSLVAPVIQAIKELHQKVKYVLAKISGHDREIEELKERTYRAERENAEMKERLKKLEVLLLRPKP